MKPVRSVSIVSCMLLVLASFSFCLLCEGEAAAQTKTLKIGLISSVSGPMAPAFASELGAAKPAADLINQKGGLTVGGQKYNVEIVTGDDQSSPPGAVAAANKLLQDGVKFIISPMFVPNDMAIAPICEDAKILRVCPNRADPTTFGAPNKYSFNAEASTFNIPYFHDKLATLYPKAKKVAMVWPDDPGAKVYAELTIKDMKRRGLDLVFNEAYKIPTEDFYPLLTKALQQKPDMIQCLFAILPWAKGIIDQSRELGFTGPIVAAASFGDTNLLKGMIDPKSAYDICHASPDVNSPKMLPIVKDFRKLVEAQTKEKFNFDHVMTLQALMVITQGIEKAQSFETDKVLATLETASSIDSPYGKGRFAGKEFVGQNRLMHRNIPFSRIMKDGKVEFEFLQVK